MTTALPNFRKYNFSFSERWAVFKAYGQVCIYCGNIVEWRDFEVDHIISESLLQEPDKFYTMIKEYGLGHDFSINSFQNWACSHQRCNRAKADTTFNKSRALHYLTIAEKKAKPAQIIYNSTEKANKVNKILAPLRALIENGTISTREIIEFANTIVRNADVGLNNPLIICFGLRMEDVYANFPENAPDSPPYIYDWLESQLTKELQKQLECRLALCESERNGETISVRYALWDLDYEKLNNLKVRWWEILELTLHTEIYGEFIQQ
jgi:HNH endonuclease.